MSAPFTLPYETHAVIVGGGTMGADVAIVLARAACHTIIVESSENRRALLPTYIKEGLTKQSSSDFFDQVSIVSKIEEINWEMIDIAIECIPEKLEIKQHLFAELEKICSPHTILCSNSSSFPISAISKGLKSNHRMLGLHFFMPAHLVPLVEVVLGEKSDPELAKPVAELMRGCGMVPVLVKKDLPGFLANRMQHALAREAFHMIDEGIASPEDVDAAVRFGFGFRFLAAGPVMQRDHAGLEVHTAAAASMYPSLATNSTPAKVLQERVNRKDLGMKTGQGFFSWTPESIAIERKRYDDLLTKGLEIISNELPSIKKPS